MKYVACYCRVSTDEQAKFGFSIQAQKDALEKYCKENGYKYEFYIDEGISASSMKKRKALNEMLSKSSAFDMVLFTKLDRLSRNVLDANNINKLLIDNNCTMKAIDEDDIDTSTADGTFIFNLKVSLAQREIGKTSERINFVFKNKREKGEITSGTKKYGYDIVGKHFVINEKEAENIRNLYQKFIDTNGSPLKTYEYFITCFPSKGYDAMSNYLRETAYIGKYKLYRKSIYLENYIPRIMDDELFYRVQNLLKRKQKILTKNDKPSLFVGLVFCSVCGNRMYKKQDNRVASQLIRYCCDNFRKFKIGSTERKCYNSNSIREDTVEDYLLKNLKTKLDEYKVTTKIIKEKVVKSNPKKEENIKNKMYKLKDLYLDDLIDKETYKSEYQKLQAQLQEVQKQTTIVNEKKDFSKIEKILNSDYIKIYNNLSLENKRKFWLSIIDKIYVENGEIKEVTFL